jgi:hypothetical protein
MYLQVCLSGNKWEFHCKLFTGPEYSHPKEVGEYHHHLAARTNDSGPLGEFGYFISLLYENVVNN